MAVEWTDAEREALRDVPGLTAEEDDAILDALAPSRAARDAQVAARALREASSWLMDLPSRRGSAVYADERMHADGQDVGIEIAADHLRDRADRIERGES